MTKNISQKSTGSAQKDHRSPVSKSRYELSCRLDNDTEMHDIGDFSKVLRIFLEISYSAGFKEAVFRRIDPKRRTER